MHLEKANSFNKEERLKSRKRIDELFEKGRGFSVPPLRIIYILEPSSEASQLQLAVSAPKKNFKKAVDRNRIKRLLRETFRLNKHALTSTAENKKLNVSFFINYTSKEIESFEAISRAMTRALHKLEHHIISYESNS